MKIPAVLFCLAFFAVTATATVRYVDLNSTNPVSPYTDWSTAATNIQDAVDAAASGDEVLVTNGLYQTGARSGGDGVPTSVVVTNPLSLQSVNGAGVTVIDGGGSMRCVYLANGAVLSGFTLRNGNVVSGAGGGAVRCASYSNEVVTSCVIISNTAPSGGGIFQGAVNNCIIAWNNAASSSGGGTESCLVNSCILSNNSSALFGGGASGGVSALNNCLVLGNTAANGGGGVFGSTLNNCLVLSNICHGGAGGTYQCILNNCTICANSAPGVEMVSGFGIIPEANNCIIYYNSPSGAGANFISSTALHNCCTTPLPSVSGNITNPPLFLNLAGGDFHLASSSPCINSGNNAYVAVLTDFDGNSRIRGGTVDIGAYEYQSPTSLISYAWLQQYGFVTDGSADFADPDRDGMNNWQEWIAGTNPTNAASVLRMVTASNSPTGVAVSWQSVTNRSYFVQRASDLGAQPAFNTVASGVAGKNATTSYTDTNATGTGSFLYRVGVQQ
jgi:hypothetical protein